MKYSFSLEIFCAKNNGANDGDDMLKTFMVMGW